MSCFGCFRKKKREKRVSTIDLDFIEANNNILKYNSEKRLKKSSTIISSPFRRPAKSELDKSDQSKLTEVLDVKTGIIKLQTMKKQRFSVLNNNNFEFITEMLKKEGIDSTSSTKPFWNKKDTLICKMGCGGDSCKHEDHTNNVNENAIRGLNSDYITESIIGSQRISTILVRKYNLYEKFKE